MGEKKQDLVSIIVPVYNAGRFLDDTINSVLEQTYRNWELILVDDSSTDNSLDIASIFSRRDSRIKVYHLKKQEHVSYVRNYGIAKSSGRFIAFLDADDLWIKDKLEKQIDFMKKKKIGFSFTGYIFANEDGVPGRFIVHVPEVMHYNDSLKNTTIWTTTVVFDTERVDKKLICFKNIPSEDTALWWEILRTGQYTAYGYNDILAIYRRSKKTLSSNKIKALYRILILYRKNENLSIMQTIYYFCHYAFNAVRRRI